MPYQEHESKPNLKPGDVLPFLKREIPGFTDIPLIDLNEGIYVILGDFAIYLRDGIVDGSFSDEELSRFFCALNTLGSSDDVEVHNQLVVGVLEILSDYATTVAVANARLDGRAAEMFNRVLRGWRS